MHRCSECGAEFNDVFDGRFEHKPIGYGWDPGMPKPCCGGVGPWDNAFWRGKDREWRPAKYSPNRPSRPDREEPQEEDDE